MHQFYTIGMIYDYPAYVYIYIYIHIYNPLLRRRPLRCNAYVPPKTEGNDIQSGLISIIFKLNVNIARKTGFSCFTVMYEILMGHMNNVLSVNTTFTDELAIS